MNAEEFLKKKYQKMFVKDLPSIGSYELPKIVEEFGMQQYNQALEDASKLMTNMNTVSHTDTVRTEILKLKKRVSGGY